MSPLVSVLFAAAFQVCPAPVQTSTAANQVLADPDAPPECVEQALALLRFSSPDAVQVELVRKRLDQGSAVPGYLDALALLARAKDPWAKKRLQQGVSAGPAHDRLVQASYLMEFYRDRRALDSLRTELLCSGRPLDARMELARHLVTLFGVGPAETLSAYVLLLRDPNWQLRYVAIHSLRDLTGQTLQFNHRAAPTENKAALTRWDNYLDQLADAGYPRADGASSEPLAKASITLLEQRGAVVVAKVMRGGPADKAGIQVGDVLHTINGDSVAGKPVADIVRYELSGRQCERVEMRMSRSGHARTVTMGLQIPCYQDDWEPIPCPQVEVGSTPVRKLVPCLNEDGGSMLCAVPAEDSEMPVPSACP